MLVKVRDKKTGNVRNVTQKAYAALGPKVYEKLGMVNDDGTELGGQPLPNSNQPQVSRSVKGAAPVVVKSQLAPIPDELPVDTDEEIEPEKVRLKPGPKPKNKSISSNSTDDEQ